MLSLFPYSAMVAVEVEAQPENAYPSRVKALCGHSAFVLSVTVIVAISPVPPFASNVIVYRLGTSELRRFSQETRKDRKENAYDQ
jgi:hypothetical protein